MNREAINSSASDPSAPAWSGDDLARNPHAAPDKARRVERMFAAIAPWYDFNNRVLSLGLDQRWRKVAVDMADLQPTDRVADIACGTGDLTLAFTQRLAKLNRKAPHLAQPVLGLDFTHAMLPIAKAKSTPTPPHPTTTPPNHPTTYATADAMRLPLPDACVDVVSIAFGIRNVAEPPAALAEFFRVLRPAGRLVILEFATPRNPIARLGNSVYCDHILPRLATLISRDRSGAYHYLPKSIATFTQPEQLAEMAQAVGFTAPALRRLTLGTAAVTRLTKPA
ncbi:MAG: bifunctional demethylmenaquinone methyltransferase/2-methoxy-6-polyprenyl-1,4-benzoquinol methylase UbiE [Planctomycetota bacterium]